MGGCNAIENNPSGSPTIPCGQFNPQTNKLPQTQVWKSVSISLNDLWDNRDHNANPSVFDGKWLKLAWELFGTELHDLDVFNERDSGFECAVCIEPIATKNLGRLMCGHHFCVNCIMMHRVHNRDPVCPICRGMIRDCQPEFQNILKKWFLNQPKDSRREYGQRYVGSFAIFLLLKFCDSIRNDYPNKFCNQIRFDIDGILVEMFAEFFTKNQAKQYYKEIEKFMDLYPTWNNKPDDYPDHWVSKVSVCERLHRFLRVVCRSKANFIDAVGETRLAILQSRIENHFPDIYQK